MAKRGMGWGEILGFRTCVCREIENKAVVKAISFHGGDWGYSGWRGDRSWGGDGWRHGVTPRVLLLIKFQIGGCDFVS